MAKKIVRVVIPKNPDKMIVLAKKVVAKHIADGVSSVLKDMDMTDMGTKTTAADTLAISADALHKSAEEENEKRNKVLGIMRDQNSTTEGTLYFYLTSVRDILLGKNKGKEQALGEWGFQVNTSPPPKPKPPTV